MSVPIVPAVIPPSRAALEASFTDLAFADELSIDVVDGAFVPFSSWPYEPSGEPRAVRHLLTTRTVEVDLMVTDQVAAARSWLAAGADMLVFHARGISPEALAAVAADTNVSLGISILNDVSVDAIEPYLPSVDYIQFMGIAQIGAQGQPFDERVLAHVRTCKQRYPDYPITVDGSVNAATIPKLLAAGADRLIVGSAIVKADDPATAYAQLTALVTNNR